VIFDIDSGQLLGWSSFGLVAKLVIGSVGHSVGRKVAKSVVKSLGWLLVKLLVRSVVRSHAHEVAQFSTMALSTKSIDYLPPLPRILAFTNKPLN